MLWINQNGKTACEKHVGVYAMQELQQNPFAVEMITPLDHWLLLLDIDEDIKCESCMYDTFLKEKSNA
jgi:hypothetical protein